MSESLWRQLQAEALFPEDQVVKEVVQVLPWKVQASRKFEDQVHVNLREFDGMGQVLRHSAMVSSFSV